jgi:elongation factor P
MDTTSYEQVTLSDEVLGELIGYLVPESLIKVDFYGANPVGIELPPTVDLAVKDTSPAIKGSTANAQLKPATLETGLVIQVPPFINIGDKVRVSTESGEYQNRA